MFDTQMLDSTAGDIIAWTIFAGGAAAFLFAVGWLIYTTTTDTPRHRHRMAQHYRKSEATHQRIKNWASPDYIAQVVDHELADKPPTKPIPTTTHQEQP